MYVLESVASSCSDPALARSITLIYKAITLICLIAPILLILMVTISVISLMMSPDQKDGWKKVFKKVAAALFIFILPSVVNATMNLLQQAFVGDSESYIVNVSRCWKMAQEASKKVSDATYQSGSLPKAGTSLMGDLSGLKKYIPKNDSSSASLGDGGILIIAGHSYAPYCNQAGNECREESNMKYYEPDQTRILARLLKNELDSMNLKASIANEMLGGTDARMNKSFFVELGLNSSAFKENEPKFKQFTHVIEIHFNATGGGAHGTLLMEGSKGISKIDEELKSAVVKYTGRSLGNIRRGLRNMNYFQNLNMPITYMEVEFYDNPSAMDRYTANKEKIAHELALVFKKNYGSQISR